MSKLNNSKIFYLMILTLATTCFYASYGYGDNLFECADQEIQKEKCIGSSCEAVVFHRDCGATTAASTIVEIRNIGFFKKDKRVMVLNKQVGLKIKWTDKKVLLVSLDEELGLIKKNIFLSESKIGDITIDYKYHNN